MGSIIIFSPTMQRLSLVLFLCAAAAAVLAQDTPPADTQQEINVPTTPDGSAPAKVVLSVPISTPNGNRTLEFREGEDVQATINAFVTSEGLGEAEANAILQYVVGSARKPALSLPLTTPSGEEKVLDLYEGTDVRQAVVQFCQQNNLTQEHYEQIVAEVVRRGQPQKYAFTVPVKLGEGAENERVLHFFDNDAVAQKVLDFCNALKLDQAAFDAIVAFVQRRAETPPLLSLPFDTPSGTQTLKLYEDDSVINACRYFVHALSLGEAELRAVYGAVQTQIRLLQRDQYNSVLDTGSVVFIGLDADASGLLSVSEQTLLKPTDESPVDLNGDGSCDFFEFMATRSSNLTALLQVDNINAQLDAAIDSMIKPYSDNWMGPPAINAQGLETMLNVSYLQGNATAIVLALDKDDSKTLTSSEMKTLRSVLLNRGAINTAFDAAIKAFDRSDSNGDGALTSAELQSVTSNADAFVALDNDSDGSVTLAEFLAAAMSQPRIHAVSNFTSGDITPVEGGGIVYTGRGIELIVDAALTLFRRYDLDSNGTLSESEAAQLLAAEFAEGKSPSADVLSAVLPKSEEGVSRESFRTSLLSTGPGQVFLSKCQSLRQVLGESAQKGIHALSPESFNAVKEKSADSPSQPSSSAITTLFSSLN